MAKQDWWGVVKSVGSAVVSNVVPGGAAIVDLVNNFLPDDEKLPSAATGDQVKGAVESMPAEVRGALMMKELDIEIEEIRSWSSIQDSLARADQSGSSTRPDIAMMMAWVVVVSIGLFTLAWGWAVVTSSDDPLKTLSESWQLLLTLLGTPTVLLRAYFGMRTAEKKARYSAASGLPIDDGPLRALMGVVSKRLAA